MQLAVQDAVVVAGLGESGLRLDVRIQHHADRVPVLQPLAPEGVEGELAVVTVLTAAQASVALRVEAHFLALRRRHRRPRYIGVGEQAVGVLRRREGLRQVGQRLFGLGAQCVRRVTQRVVQLERKRRQPLVFADVGLDDLASDLDELRLHPCRRLRKARKHDLAELVPFLRIRDAQVLVSVQ